MARKNCHRCVHTNYSTVFYYTVESYQKIAKQLSGFGNGNKNVFIVEYSPFLFGSLFSKTPREEFSLLFDCFKSKKECSNENFVSDKLNWWSLKDVSDLAFHELSGGYRKLVFVATQIEARSEGENVIGVNIQQQIDLKRFRIIENTLKNKGVNSVLWIDDNPKLLLQKSCMSPQEISFSNWVNTL